MANPVFISPRVIFEVVTELGDIQIKHFHLCSVIHPFLASSPSFHQKPSLSGQTDPPRTPMPLTSAQLLLPASQRLPPYTLTRCGPSRLRERQRPQSSPRPLPPRPPSRTTTRNQTTTTPSAFSSHGPLPLPPPPPPLEESKCPQVLQPSRARAVGSRVEMTRPRKRTSRMRKQVAASRRKPVGQRSLSVNPCSFTSYP